MLDIIYYAASKVRSPITGTLPAMYVITSITGVMDTEDDDLPTVTSLRYTNTISLKVLFVTQLVVKFVIFTTHILFLRLMVKYARVILSSGLAFEYSCFVLLPTLLICCVKFIYKSRRSTVMAARQYHSREHRHHRSHNVNNLVCSSLAWMARNGYI